LVVLTGATALAQPSEAGGEASLQLPDLSSVSFLGIDGHKLLLVGLLFCLFGLAFGMAIYMQLKNAPVHRSMREISELIYETCKTYLVTQGKFILVLWVFIAVIITAYFGWLSPVPGKPIAVTLPIILLFRLIGIAGSYGVAWFGIRVNTFANSRTAFAGLSGKPYPIYAIPLKAGMSIGMMLISVELLLMLIILLFVFEWFYPVAFELWNLYHTKAVDRKIGIERLRDLFEQAVEGCPPRFAKVLYLMYGNLEEERGLARHAMRIYERATRAVSDEDRADMFNFYITKSASNFGLPSTRPIGAGPEFGIRRRRRKRH
jgi:hypothetical protein